MNSAKWREELPDGCPPLDSGPISETVLIRLVPTEPVTDNDFCSHKALGYPLTKPGEEASWASCSMFLTSYEAHRLKALSKFPRLKHLKSVAYVRVNEASGVARVSSSKHVDLWMYSDYEPAKAVLNVVDLNAYQPR